jgi:hypothetical protein
MSENKPFAESELYTGVQPGWDVQPVVEQVWSDLGGIVSRTVICRELAEVIPAFEDARITIYVPIFVRRQTVERLRTGLSGATPQEHF